MMRWPSRCPLLPPQICIGGEAKQKEGHSSTSLGKWGGGMSSGHLNYANGAACWQGPKRSFNVSLQCGADEELVDIEEPSRCEYTAVLRTPAACHEDDVAGSKAKLEELRTMVKQVRGCLCCLCLCCISLSLFSLSLSSLSLSLSLSSLSLSLSLSLHLSVCLSVCCCFETGHMFNSCASV